MRDEQLERDRAIFQKTFTTTEGRECLTIIRNRLGANCIEAEKIKPELVVFDRWLLYMIGIHTHNVQEVTDALLGCANNDDIEVKNG